MAEGLGIVPVQASGAAWEYRGIRRDGETLDFQNSTPEQDSGNANSL